MGRAADASQHGTAQPVSARLCDALCFAAALWTLCCHAVVAGGGSLYDLLQVAGVAGVLAIGAAFALRTRIRRSLRDASDEAHAAATPPTDAFSVRVRIAAATCGVAGVALSIQLGSTAALWWSCVASLSFAFGVCVFAGPQPDPNPPARKSRRLEMGLWALALLCTGLALRYRRADLDIPFYLSLANAAVDAPRQPLMLDSIHGVAGLGLHMPAHRVHTFELFNAALSSLSGRPVIWMYQIGLAAVSAALVPLAFARLFRILAPGHWLWAVAFVIAILVGGGGALSWYGNLSIVRIFHGKSVYLSVVLPLLIAYGLRFGAQPTGARGLRLCAAQIAALGLTSSALWSAPIASGLAVACAVHWNRRTWRTLACAALASSYLVAVGIWLAGQLAPIAAEVAADPAPGLMFRDALQRVLGHDRLVLVSFGAVAISWTALRGTAQRFAIGFPLAVLLLVLNPYTSDTAARLLTGPSYWRAMWVLPIPVLLALLLSAPLAWEGGHRARRVAGALGAVAAFVSLAAPFSSLSPRNQVAAAKWGQLTVPTHFYAVAKALTRNAPAGSMVVAPQKVALWSIAFHHHPNVSYAREVYLRRISAELGSEEAGLRMLMSDLVSADADIEQRIRETAGFQLRARQPNAVRAFRRGLTQLEVSAVCINQHATHVKRLRQVLGGSGFTLRGDLHGYEIWTRDL
jgi:hypothetical protein